MNALSFVQPNVMKALNWVALVAMMIMVVRCQVLASQQKVNSQVVQSRPNGFLSEFDFFNLYI